MSLKSKKFVILVEQHYQDLEVWYPYYRLKEEGADVIFAGSGSNEQYQGKYGYPLKVSKSAEALKAKDFHGVLIPGGWAPDFLRRYAPVLKFVREMNESKKVVAAICHAGWVLASAKILRGRNATCFSAIKDDVLNAGAKYIDDEVVVDKNLITARTPEDLPAFMREVIKALRDA